MFVSFSPDLRSVPPACGWISHCCKEVRGNPSACWDNRPQIQHLLHLQQSLPISPLFFLEKSVEEMVTVTGLQGTWQPTVNANRLPSTWNEVIWPWMFYGGWKCFMGHKIPVPRLSRLQMVVEKPVISWGLPVHIRMEGFSTTHNLVGKGDGSAEMAKLTSLIREKTISIADL